MYRYVHLYYAREKADKFRNPALYKRFPPGALDQGSCLSSCSRAPVYREEPSPPDHGALSRKAAGRSRVPLHRLLEAELAPGGDDGQPVRQVVVDEVADAVEDPVPRPDL